jgi:hypothetical protein
MRVQADDFRSPGERTRACVVPDLAKAVGFPRRASSPDELIVDELTARAFFWLDTEDSSSKRAPAANQSKA